MLSRGGTRILRLVSWARRPSHPEPPEPPEPPLPPDLEPGTTRQAVLERLARHEISAQEAAVAIRALGRNR